MIRLATLGLLLGACASLPAAAQNYGVPLPNPAIPGYTFPETEDVILGWVNSQPENVGRIYLHGWGLWASLTMPSGTSAYGLPNAPVYLTWLTKADLKAMSTHSRGAAAAATESGGRTKPLFGPITQLLKFHINSERTQPRVAAAGTIQPDTTSLESVSYDPTAAKHIHDLKLFDPATMTGLRAAGKTTIPTFPNNAVAVKPVYKVIRKASLVKGRYYAMPAWQGTPDLSTDIIENGFGEASWPGCVYVDTHNHGASSASGIDHGCTGPTADNTYGLGDFVSFPVTKEIAAEFTGKTPQVEVGDTMLLIAMHVTSREITEWTWQTFFWTHKPSAPPSPSSRAVAAALPTEIFGARAHYAGSFAYQMISPNQPVNYGDGRGTPVIGYNPYLEAGFPASVFVPTGGSAFLRSVQQKGDPKTAPTWTGIVGMQTNCMTCHSLAAVTFTPGFSMPYATTFYIQRIDPIFDNTVQTDFLWSVADEAQPSN